MRAVAVVAAALLAGCPDDGGTELLRVNAVEPRSGVSGHQTFVHIHGHFPLSVQIDFSGQGNSRVETDYRVELSGSALESVAYIDAETLAAVVPAALPPGIHDLTLVDPHGHSVVLADAFDVVAWWDTAWSTRLRLVVGGGTSGLVDFPLLVKLDQTRIDYSRTTGSDLRFVDADSNTVLAHEIESWDEAGASFVWVGMPQLLAGVSTVVHLYYDNPSALDSQDSSSVWGLSDHRGVWHLGGNVEDSTANVNHGADNGTTDIAGAVGRSRHFEGGAHVDLGNGPSLQLAGAATVEAWVRLDALGGAHHPVVNKGDFSYALKIYLDDKVEFHVHDASWRATFSDVVAPLGVWTYLAGTFDGTTLNCYVDGVEQAQVQTASSIEPSSTALAIGHNGDLPERVFLGSIDEVRVSGTARSADWIATQYQSMTDALVSFDGEESRP